MCSLDGDGQEGEEQNSFRRSEEILNERGLGLCKQLVLPKKDRKCTIDDKKKQERGV
jgi:hypothetical protein